MSKSGKHVQDSQGSCPNCENDNVECIQEYAGKKILYCKDCRCHITEHYQTEYIHSTFEKEDDPDYFECCEGHCPKCKSRDIESLGIHNDDFISDYQWKCNKCGCEFEEEHVLKYCNTRILKD